MPATLANNNELRIRFTGRHDKNEDDFYVAHVKIPCSVDLSNSVLLFFPDETEKGFGGDLIIRKQDNKVLQRLQKEGREASQDKEPSDDQE